MKALFWTIISTVILFSCRDAKIEPPEKILHEWDFLQDAGGWAGNFADYPVGSEDFYELEFAYGKLPAPLDTTRGALKLSGSNRSDDLFMYVYRKITGLVPGRVYHISFFVEFASDVPDNMIGIGGSPGESVYIKAGAADVEPDREPDDQEHYRMNIDKGNQSQGGDNMIVIGDFSNDTDQQVYTLKSVDSGEQAFSVVPNDAGELWLIVGTDSGFEGTTTIYFSFIRVELIY